MPDSDVFYGFMPYPRVPSAHAASGLLCGLSFAVKDLFDVAGYPTSGGQPMLLAKSGIKTKTATTVQRLLDAGASLAGKTVTDELAFSIVGNNAHFGAPVNAATPDRFTGGSSSGSAGVVAGGFVDFAIGTDTGGSVRAPASNCGLFGIRPTHGRVSLEGALDLAPSFDTCGWFSRDIKTFDRVAEVLLGKDLSPLPQAIRLIEPSDVWAECSAEISEAFSESRARIRRQCREVQTSAIALESFDQMFAHFRAIQGFEAWKTHGAFIQKEKPVLGPGVAERFALAREVSRETHQSAVGFRQMFRKKISALLGHDGVLLIPTMTKVSPLRTASEAELDAYRASTFRILCIAGLGGLPQITLPLVHQREAALGLSLVGPAGSDRSLVALAGQLLSGSETFHPSPT